MATVNVLRWIDAILIRLSSAAIKREAARRREAGKVYTCGLCNAQAIHRVAWGCAASQESNLCEPHMRELWDRCKPSVALGVGFWIQSECR